VRPGLAFTAAHGPFACQQPGCLGDDGVLLFTAVAPIVDDHPIPSSAPFVCAGGVGVKQGKGAAVSLGLYNRQPDFVFRVETGRSNPFEFTCLGSLPVFGVQLQQQRNRRLFLLFVRLVTAAGRSLPAAAHSRTA
jgi:hypothetical protein